MWYIVAMVSFLSIPRWILPQLEEEILRPAQLHSILLCGGRRPEA